MNTRRHKMIERSGGDETIHTHRKFAGIACVLVTLHVHRRSVGVARRGDSLAGKKFGDQCCPLAIVLARILIRNEFEKDLHPGIGHETREMTRSIVLEAATGRIGRLVADLCQIQRHGIHEGRVAAAVLHEDRVIGYCRIQIMPVDRARSFAIVVQKSEHPFSGRSLQRALVQSSLYFFDGVFIASYFV